MLNHELVYERLMWDNVCDKSLQTWPWAVRMYNVIVLHSGESKCINLPLSQYIVEQYDVQMLFNIWSPGCWMEQHDVEDKSFHFSHEIHSWKKGTGCIMCVTMSLSKSSNIFTIVSKK